MVSCSFSGPQSSFAAFSDPELCRGLLDRLHRELDGPLRFMEVCGTHTVAIFQSGLRSLLPSQITHLSGPGCPVCVTHEREVAAFLQLAQRNEVTIATFGDLMRVPGPGGQTLKKAKAAGADVAVVYSPLDALELARKRPDRKVVFLGVGFETTAPTVAATVQMAKAVRCTNFFVLPFHKLVPPALDLLLTETKDSTDRGIDAFLLPGHVAAILGVAPHSFIAEKYGKTGIIGGFDPADILESLLLMVQMRKRGTPCVINEYSRVVSADGNPKALSIMLDVFAPCDALWRGLGLLEQSGLTIRPEYAAFNAFEHFALALPEVPPLKGCLCGDVLRGRIEPVQCPVFGKACTPATPVGPCMVSTEGSCAAYYKYQGGQPL